MRLNVLSPDLVVTSYDSSGTAHYWVDADPVLWAGEWRMYAREEYTSMSTLGWEHEYFTASETTFRSSVLP